MDNTSKATPNQKPAETLEQQIARLTAENANLHRAATQRASRDLTVGHSKDTGVVMVKGLGRFPVSLYPDQWVKVLAISGDIAAYLRDHATELEQIRLVRDADRKAQ